MWKGYVAFDDTEIVNVSRTEAYAADHPWFKPLYRNPVLAAALGHVPYTDPVTDGAPWWDPDEPAAGEFLGAYPLDITGLAHSTRASDSFATSKGGGTPGRLRYDFKTGTFGLVLLGATEAGAKYGYRWLKAATIGAPCSPNDTTKQPLGADLTYFESTPLEDLDSTDSPEESAIANTRVLHQFVINSGPVITAERKIHGCDGYIITVTFTGIAGRPYEYGLPRTLLSGYLDPDVADPWSPDYPTGTVDAPVAWDEVDCGVDLWDPIYDPTCAALITPPPPPSIPLGCFTPPATWTRHVAHLPAAAFNLWTDVLPVITITAAADEELRNLRLRFYPDPDGDLVVDDDPCSFSSDIVVTYLPAGGVMTIDASDETVRVRTATGQTRRADTLVVATPGSPISWPALGCGYGHVMTVDVEESVITDPVIGLSLVPRIV